LPRPHRVPLSDRAIAILKGRAEQRAMDSSLVFPGFRRDRPLSDMALTAVLRRMGLRGVTVHGMRSTFRDWAGEHTSFAREVAEAALAHLVGDAAERAYRRGDALEKRRMLMDQWATFLRGKRDNVVPMTRA